MKKLFLFAQIIVFTILYSAWAVADDDDDDDDWDEVYIAQPEVDYYYPVPAYPAPQINNYYPQPQVNNYYPQPQINNYYPQPRINNYYPGPQVNNYPQQNQYYGNRRPSAQGLAGSVIGDVLGYELGNGNPLTSGLGSAAGAYLGNGFGSYQ